MIQLTDVLRDIVTTVRLLDSKVAISDMTHEERMQHLADAVLRCYRNRGWQLVPRAATSNMLRHIVKELDHRSFHRAQNTWIRALDDAPDIVVECEDDSAKIEMLEARIEVLERRLEGID